MSYTPSSTAGETLEVEIATVDTLIPGVQNISGSGGDKTDIEVTAISDLSQVFVGGRRNGREVSCSIAWDDDNAVHAALLNNYNAAGSVAMNFTHTDPAGTVETYSAYVKSLVRGTDREGFKRRDMVLKLTTEITTVA